MNCWEFKNCGREINGRNVASLGVCPVCTESKVNGVNNGKNGGRCCWAIAGTLCGGEVQGSFIDKVHSCINCDFYHMVFKEERNNYTKPTEVIRILHAS